MRLQLGGAEVVQALRRALNLNAVNAEIINLQWRSLFMPSSEPFGFANVQFKG